MHGCGIVEVDLSFDNDQLFAATYAPAILYIICGVPSICLSVSSGRGSTSLLVWEWLTHRGVTGKSFPPSPHTNSSTLLYKWNMTLEPVKDSHCSVWCAVFLEGMILYSVADCSAFSKNNRHAPQDCLDWNRLEPTWIFYVLFRRRERIKGGREGGRGWMSLDVSESALPSWVVLLMLLALTPKHCLTHIPIQSYTRMHTALSFLHPVSLSLSLHFSVSK